MSEIIDRNIVKCALTKRSENADKFSVGTMLSICGSYGMAGAAIMSGKAALRSGVGLLRMVIPDSIYTVMASSIFEAVFCPVKDGTAAKDVYFIQKLNNNNAVLAGCGLSLDSRARDLVKTIIETAEIPVVFDADALNIIADNLDILRDISAPVVVTPHIGEMSRLTKLDADVIANDRGKYALDFSKRYNVITVLKGHVTVVASPDGRVMRNENAGNAGMASAGSGDVLAGIITSLIAQGSDPFLSACAGVYIHAVSGDIAKELLGERSMLASDIIECITKAFEQIKL